MYGFKQGLMKYFLYLTRRIGVWSLCSRLPVGWLKENVW